MVPLAGYAIADIETLKGIVASERSDGYTLLVKSSGAVATPAWYTFIATSTQVPDDNFCVQPVDNPAKGRWLKSSASSNQYWAEAVHTIDDLRAVTVALRRGYQNRMVLQTEEGAQQYNFNPEKLGLDDNNLIIKPNDVGNNQSGRWQPINKGNQGDQGLPGTAEAASGLILRLVRTPPQTSASSVAIFADITDGQVKVRAPNNGAITILGSYSPFTQPLTNSSLLGNDAILGNND